MNASHATSEVDQSALQLAIDQLEELVVTIIEEIRERPGVAAAILAGLIGAIVGSMLASGASRPRTVARGVEKRAGRVGDMAALAGLAFKLLENPIVRSYAVAMVTGQLRKRMRI